MTDLNNIFKDAMKDSRSLVRALKIYRTIGEQNSLLKLQEKRFYTLSRNIDTLASQIENLKQEQDVSLLSIGSRELEIDLIISYLRIGIYEDHSYKSE